MPQLTTLIPSFAAPVTDRVWRLPHIKGLELDGFPRRYPAAYSRLVKDVDAMPRATAHVG